MKVTTDCRDTWNMVRFLVVDICQCASSQSSPHPSRNQELAWQCLPSKYVPCKYPEGSTLPEGTREILGTHRGSIYSPPHMRTTAFHLHWPEHWCGAHFGMKQTNWIRILFPPVEMKRNGFGDHIHVFWIHCAENRADFSLHLVIEPPVSSNISAREIWAMMRRQKKNGNPVEMGANWVQGTREDDGPENPIWALVKKHGIQM